MEIILVQFNQPELTAETIKSIKKHTKGPYKLTVHDNYPQNENLAIVWNRLIEQSDEEIICLFNDDAVAEEGWDKMREVLKDPKVGAVGPTTNNCGSEQKDMPRADKIQESKDISGFCYLFRKSVWEEVGRFPEDFPFYGQESVFNRKLQAAGYKLMIDRRVFIYHHKGQSYKKAVKDGIVKDDQRTRGAFHYWNFLDRLNKVKHLPKPVILGAGKGNPFPTFMGIDQFVSDFGGVHLPSEASYEEIMSHKPEIVIVVQSRYIPELLQNVLKLKMAGVKTALYFMDLRENWNCPILPYDNVFLCAEGLVEKWKEKYKTNVHWLPQATIQQPVIPEGKGYHLVHIGDLTSHIHVNRKRIADQLNPKQINEVDREKRAKVVSEMWGVYSNSDFSLAVSPEVKGYTSDRIYHIMGSGGCLLSYDPGGLDHLKRYGLWFKTVEEAKRLLETPKEVRDLIKEKAFDYTQTNHLYKDRLIKILCTGLKN
jgi:hypothetical protein